MASKKKSPFALFLLSFAVVVMMLLSVLKNDVPVLLFIIFSLGLLYITGLAVYMICKNRTFKWFLTPDASHKKKTNKPSATRESNAKPSVSKSTKAVTKSEEIQSDQSKSQTTSKKPAASKKPVNVQTENNKTSKAKNASTKPATADSNVKPIQEVNEEQET